MMGYYGNVRTDRLIRWNVQRTDGPAAPAVPLGDLKAQVRLTLAEIAEDDLIEQMGLAAEEAVEAELGAALLTQSWKLRLDAFPCWELRLPRPSVGKTGPSLSSVEQVAYVDPDGVTRVLDPATYDVDSSSRPGAVRPGYGLVWPTTRDVPNAVTVAYVVGRATADEVPAMVRAAIRLVVGDLYENRERSAAEAVRALDMYERMMGEHRCVYEFNYR